MCTFGYLKTLDIILSLVYLQKLDWTHTFDTHYIYIYIYIMIYLAAHISLYLYGYIT